MYLIDTNPVSEPRGGTPQAVSWLRSVDPLGIHLSALTLGEIMRGIALKKMSDPKTAAHLTEWLRKLRHDHGDRIFADNRPNRGRMGPHRGNPPPRRYQRVDRRDRDRPRSHPCHKHRQGF
jgi:predicted nucleic acid-binding protein